jgi:hypothetical protein
MSSARLNRESYQRSPLFGGECSQKRLLGADHILFEEEFVHAGIVLRADEEERGLVRAVRAQNSCANSDAQIQICHALMLADTALRPITQLNGSGGSLGGAAERRGARGQRSRACC